MLVPDWPLRTTQPGDALRDIFTALGACVEHDETGLTVTGPDRVHGIDVDLGEVGELTPVLAAVAALADAPSRLRGVAHLRLHETDRLAALTKEIKALGGDVTRDRRRPADPAAPAARRASSTPTTTTGWPRAAVLGLGVPGVQIENVATTAKTLPDFPELWTGMLG